MLEADCVLTVGINVKTLSENVFINNPYDAITPVSAAD